MKLSGGLGNQLNHFFYSQYLSEYHSDKIVFDTSLIRKDWQCINYLPYFGIRLDYLSISSLKTRTFALENNLHIEGYDKNKFYILNNYYEHPFVLDPNLAEKTNRIKYDTKLLNYKDKLILDEISAHNSCGIHIRRGDYYNIKKTREVFGILDIEYYNNAIDQIEKNFKDIQFYVFSDEPDWVRKNLDLRPNFTVIEHNISRLVGKHDNLAAVRYTKLILKPLYRTRLLRTFNDFYLLSRCKHFIISNSSFSWWAAYLGKHNKKVVICPEHWNTRRKSDSTTPKEWIKL